MPDLKPSEELIGHPDERSMRSDLRLLCGIYDELRLLNQRLEADREERRASVAMLEPLVLKAPAAKMESAPVAVKPEPAPKPGKPAGSK